MKNVEKNQEIMECVACGFHHLKEKGLKNFSFECENCGNLIYVNEKNNQVVFGTLKNANSINKNSDENNNKSDNKEMDNQVDDKEFEKQISTETTITEKIPFIDD